MKNERVTFLTTPEAKAAIVARAAQRGMSTGEYIRLAVENMPEETEEEIELAALVDELVSAIPDMRASLERTTRLLESSQKEMARMMREAGVRK